MRILNIFIWQALEGIRLAFSNFDRLNCLTRKYCVQKMNSLCHREPIQRRAQRFKPLYRLNHYFVHVKLNKTELKKGIFTDVLDQTLEMLSHILAVIRPGPVWKCANVSLGCTVSQCMS